MHLQLVEQLNARHWYPVLDRRDDGTAGGLHVGKAALSLRMEPGMEIDFGGIGKEYAVDRAITLLEGGPEASWL